MNKIEYIKSNYTIRELAEQFGAKPDRSGKCKLNPIRVEKTSSLQIYDETNTFCDFGSTLTGDVITFFAMYHSLDISDAIESMLRDIGKTGDDFIKKEVKTLQPTKKEYMSVEAVKKAFNKPSFKEWYATVPTQKNDTSSYDLEKAYGDLPYSQMKRFAESEAHLPDTYKKPNHPTFSNESIYHNDKTPG